MVCHGHRRGYTAPGRVGGVAYREVDIGADAEILMQVGISLEVGLRRRARSRSRSSRTNIASYSASVPSAFPHAYHQNKHGDKGTANLESRPVNRHRHASRSSSFWLESLLQYTGCIPTSSLWDPSGCLFGLDREYDDCQWKTYQVENSSGGPGRRRTGTIVARTAQHHTESDLISHLQHTKTFISCISAGDQTRSNCIRQVLRT